MFPHVVIDLEAPATWPTDLSDFLVAHEADLRGWYGEPRTTRPDLFDAVVHAIRGVIAPYYLAGLHCTRLTEPEIESILQGGMQLPDGAMLTARIDRLQRDGLIDQSFADALRKNHLSDDEYRRRRIWFCFFPPRLGGEWGIGELLGCWGGEALYRGVGSDPRLKRIGIPCLVEADVRIGTLGHQPYFKMFHIWLRHRGCDLGEPTEHEDFTTAPIPDQHIRRVILFPDPEFVALTGCDRWDEPLELHSAPVL
jgi:hypothetical protein